jgi:hypothetical protein
MNGSVRSIQTNDLFATGSLALGGRVLAMAAAVFLFMPAIAAGQTVTFEQDAVGSPPKDFDYGLAGEGEPGRWEMVQDRTATGGKALAQLTTDPADYRFLVAIYKPMVAANAEITVHCKPVGGKIDRACGVIVRAIHGQNYYVARANALEDNVRFYRVRNGQRPQLASADGVKVASGQWHTLTLRVEGDRFSVAFNGKPMHTTTDMTPALPRPIEGRVGLWTKADSVTYFDRVEIKVLQ